MEFKFLQRYNRTPKNGVAIIIILLHIGTKHSQV